MQWSFQIESDSTFSSNQAKIENDNTDVPDSADKSISATNISSNTKASILIKNDYINRPFDLDDSPNPCSSLKITNQNQDSKYSSDLISCSSNNTYGLSSNDLIVDV